MTGDHPTRVDAHTWLDRLAPEAVARLVAQLGGRVCERCGRLASIRTSKRAQARGRRLAYLRCTCGRTWKALL